MFVEPDMTTISITDPSVVWLVADVFESQASFVHEGMEAEIRVAGMPGRVWTGVVEYVYPDLRPETRTVQLRLRLDNPGLALKPNMYASVSLATKAKENVLAVPQGAVIRTGRSDRLVKAVGEGRFKAIPVKLGQNVGDRFEILEGVSEGDRVVVSAQFLIDSESSLTAGFRQMEDVESSSQQTATTTTGRIDVMGEFYCGGDEKDWWTKTATYHKSGRTMTFAKMGSFIPDKNIQAIQALEDCYSLEGELLALTGNVDP